MVKHLIYSVRGRLLLVLVVSFVLISVFGIIYLLKSNETFQLESKQSIHNHLAEHIAHHYTFDDRGIIDTKKIKHVFHELMILGPSFEFYILDQNGFVVAFDADPEKIKRSKVALLPIQQYLSSGKKKFPLYGDNPRSTNQQKIFSAAKISNNRNDHLGYVYIILNSDIYDDANAALSDSKIISWGTSVFISGLVFGLIAILVITGFTTNPLKKLVGQIQNIQQKGIDKESISKNSLTESLECWQDNNVNEIHILGANFRVLLETLAEQYEKVKTIDELRQELLSHISHDLRTPLASLLGYLETWELKYPDLSQEESKKYIRTAKVSAKKISTLIEQLFELAHLDGNNVQVHQERFSLPELVQDVLKKFEIQAREKGVRLEVTPKDTRITVIGDIEKLDRVFTNLVENGLRHTNSGGSINIRLTPDARFIAIEVSDTGIGIPPEDLPHVFEPHYKAGNSVRENTAHGGLGLAITKKLLNLHQTPISVESKLNEGTTFAFNLPAATQT